MDKRLFDKIFDEVRPVQNPEELHWLVGNVEDLKPRIILEIGTEFGGTFKFWEELVSKDGLLIGVDKDHRIRWDMSKSTKNIRLVTGDSTNQDIIKQVEKLLSGTKEGVIDFIFIDGGHDEKTVTSDFENYSKFLKPKGHVAFHDVNDLVGVKQFWDKLEKHNFKYNYTANKNGIGIGLLIV